MKIDASQAIESFKDKYGDVILKIISIFSSVEENTLDDIPNEVISGLDELFAMDKVMNFMIEDYDVIIWNTVPTGHTLRLLYLPISIDSYATGVLKLYSRFAGVLNIKKTWFECGTLRSPLADALTELKETTGSIYI